MRFSCPKCGKSVDVEGDGVDVGFECPHCGASVRYSSEDIYGGKMLAGFELQEMLGVGGMGEVWLAYQQSMDRQVAVKILSPYLSNDKSFVDNFLEEVKLAAKLEHPNIVSAFDAGVDDGIYYLAMSYVPGETFAVRVARERRLPEQEILKIALHIAKALQYAWNRFKILHRDVNPANIMLTPEGDIKLMDMGISKNMEEDDGQIEESLVGTPNYISPEQIRGDKRLDVRSDIYSLGMTLYHLATGMVPFEGDDTYAVLERQLKDRLPPVEELNPQISHGCSMLIEKMVAKDRNRRPDSWEAVVDSIENLAAKTGGPESSPVEDGVSTAIHDSPHRQVKVSREHLKKVNDEHMQGGKKYQKSALPLLVLLLAMVAGSAFLALKVVDKRRSELPAEPPVGPKPPEQQAAGAGNPSTNANMGSGVTEETESREARIERAWRKVLEFERRNQGKYRQILREYNRFRDIAQGTEYAQRAENKLARFRQLHETELVMRELDLMARIQASSGNYEAAAKTYSEYSGPLAEETRERRMRFAERLLAQIDQSEEAADDDADYSRRELDDFLGDLAEDLCDANLNEALLKCRSFQQRPVDDEAKSVAENIKTYLEEIRSSDHKVISVLGSEEIDSITIVDSSGHERQVGVEVDGSTLLAEIRQGQGLAHFPFTIRQIPVEERYRILEGHMESVSRELYIGIYYVKRGQFDQAIEHFQQSGILADYLVDVVERVSKEREERRIATAVADLLRSAGVLDSDEIDWERVNSSENLEGLNQETADALLQQLVKIKQENESSEFIRDNGEEIDQFCELIETMDFEKAAKDIFSTESKVNMGSERSFYQPILRARSARGIPLRCNPRGTGRAVIPESVDDELNNNMILVLQKGDYNNRTINIERKRGVTIKAEDGVSGCSIRMNDCKDINIQGLKLDSIEISNSRYVIVDSDIQKLKSVKSSGVIHNSRIVNAVCGGEITIDHCLVNSFAAHDAEKVFLRNSIVYGRVKLRRGLEPRFIPCFRWLRDHESVVNMQNCLIYTEGAVGVVVELAYHFEQIRYWNRGLEDRIFYDLSAMEDLINLKNSHFADPLLTDPDKGDYSLRFNSPAKKASVSGKNDLGPSPNLRPFPL